ncbi:MAG: nuclear transport factor 2 family protein [Alphaproteobacteria bacterium]
MGQPSDDLNDWYAVRRAIEGYFSAVDRRDWDGVANCFTDDVSATYNTGGQVTLTGRQATLERVQIIKNATASQHLLSNTHITVSGDTAEAVTFCIATLIVGPVDGGRAVVRGIRYDDTLVRTGGSWQIKRRTHNPQWQYETKSIPAGYWPSAGATDAPR